MKEWEHAAFEHAAFEKTDAMAMLKKKKGENRGFAVLFLHVGLVCGMDNDVSPTPGGNSFLTSVQKWAPVERKRTNDALEFTFYVSCFSSWVLWKGT